MAILTRITRLFRADVHAILDAVEEPEAVLKQALREMQEALDLEKAALARNQAVLSNLHRREAAQMEELEAVQRDLEFSLREGSEELGRKTVARKLFFSRRLKALKEQIAALSELCERQSKKIEEQQAQLDSIVEKAKAFVPLAADDSALAVAQSILASSEPWGPGGRSSAGEVSEEEVELEWLRLRRQGGES